MTNCGGCCGAANPKRPILFLITIIWEIFFSKLHHLTDKLQKKTGEGPTVAPDHWTDMNQTCTDAVRDQIQMEVDASYVYLAMGAYFARDDVNMPGFSKMFFEHASEERSHALALIEYLLMRGPGKKDQKLTEKLVSVSVSDLMRDMG